MSSHKVPAFDVKANQAAPYGGFGASLAQSPATALQLQCAMAEARSRIENGFKISLGGPYAMPEQLDDIIRQMWDEGWSPEKGDINLFARDFGLVLTSALLDDCGGDVVLRSSEDLSHLSIWWPAKKLEVFPFHHMVRCLCTRGKNSVSFVKGIVDIVSSIRLPRSGR